MSAAKKNTKAGTVHKQTKQKPVHQSDPELSGESTVPAKPNFDEKDQNISPKRKSPGPGKRRRSRAGPTGAEKDSSQQPSQSPEANIKDDHDSK